LWKNGEPQQQREKADRRDRHTPLLCQPSEDAL